MAIFRILLDFDTEIFNSHCLFFLFQSECILPLSRFLLTVCVTSVSIFRFLFFPDTPYTGWIKICAFSILHIDAAVQDKSLGSEEGLFA